ncbi:MAG: hypothetical protein WA441_11400 [Methyloceanibacter sp.]
MLHRRAAHYPVALALADPPNRQCLGPWGSRSFAYREADVSVDAFAHSFIELGFAPGD